VPDEPAPTLVRTARGRLGLDGHDARLQALPLPGIAVPRRPRAIPLQVAVPA